MKCYLIGSLLFASLQSIEAQRGRKKEYEVVYRKLSGLKYDEDASYDCSMINLWTPERHPADYPDDLGTFAGDGHWSPPVWVAHDNSIAVFESGEMASQGLENVAETGNPTVLQEELAAAGDVVGSVTTGGAFLAIDLFPQDFVEGVILDKDHAYLSVVSMIAPSPSWFTGLNSYKMMKGGYWYDEVILDIFPWNAGTDGGDTYRAENEDIDETIFQFMIDNLPDTNVFASPDGKRVLPTARVNCKLHDEFPKKRGKKLRRKRRLRKNNKY